MALTGLSLAVQIATAAACSCPNPPSTLEDLIASRPDLALFVGQVTAVLSPGKGEPTVTRFSVQDVIRGDVPAAVEMTGVTFQDTPCGIDIRVGEIRTVAASKTPEGGWTTTACLMPRP